MVQPRRATYRYTAYTAAGQRQRGTLAAASPDAAERALWERGLTPTALREQATRPPVALLGGVSARTLIVLTRQMGTLLGSGVPPFRALSLLRDGATAPPLRAALTDLLTALADGRALAEGLAEHPTIFPPLYVHLVHLGERTGRLEEMLERLAGYLERDSGLVSKVRGALAYPAFILLMAVGVILLVVNITIPAVSGILADFGLELPLPTRLLLGLADFATAAALPGAALLLVGGLAGWLALRRPAMRLRWDGWLLRLPLVGGAIHHLHLARAADTLSLLLGAGLPLTEVMDLLIATTGNRALRAALTGAGAATLRGLTFAAALTEAGPLFPTVLVSMVQIGEEAGTLPAQLTMLARLYAGEADARLGRLIGLITPALTLLVGGIVLFVAVAMMGAIYAITGISDL